MANQRLQKLSEIDEHVLALLKKDIPLILGWDGELGTCLVAGIEHAKDMGPDETAFDQDEWLVYEVSDGLPGDRSTATSFYTFDEAQKAFDEVCTKMHENIMTKGFGG